jgi:hypothetical protein
MEEALNTSLTPRTQALSIIGSVFLLFVIIHLIRKEYLKEGYALLWIFTGVVVFILSAFNEVLFFFSSFIGVYYAPAALFLVLIVGLLLIAIHFSTVISKHDKRLKELAQENSLLKEEVKKLTEKN